MAWSDESHSLLHLADTWVCVHHYLWKRWHHDALWEKDKLVKAVLCSGAMFSWEILGPTITLTCTTYPNTAADQVHPFILKVFPDGSGLFQKDNTCCHTEEIVQYWFEHDRVQRVALGSQIWNLTEGCDRSMEATPYNLHLGVRYQKILSEVLWTPCLNRWELFWWQKGGLYDIKQVV